MRISTLAALQDNLIFTIGMGQLYASVEALGIEHYNALSPFKAALMAKEPLLDSTRALLDDPAFVRVVRLLATPELTFDIKGNGRLDGSYASAVYTKATEGSFDTLWTLRDANGHFTLICFKTIEEWLRFYLFSKGYSTEFTPTEALKGDVTFNRESLLLFLHALDCYQHAYYYELLNFRAFDGNFITEQDFFQLLERGCQTNDLRWLVPCALHCAPWREAPANLEFKAEHLESLQRAGLLTPTSDVADKRGFYFGADTLYMGLECAAFRKDVSGIRIRTLAANALSGLLIATEESLHWFDLNQEAITYSTHDTESLFSLLLTTSTQALRQNL